ncbi:hypothetical protein WG66_001326, partial [Moniliophthora roreri]
TRVGYISHPQPRLPVYHVISMVNLPYEVLNQIFNLYIYQDPKNVGEHVILTNGYRWPNVHDLSKGPWLLSYVCSHWRAVITSTPELWSSFCLDLPTVTHSHSELDVLKTWISRCGKRNLAIRVPADLAMYNRGKELLGIVVELTERWEELELISSNRRFWRLPNITTRLTSLKRIALLPHTVLARSRPRSYVDPSIFHGVHVPFLHSVQNHDWILLDVGTFPWVQITKYEGSERSTSHLHILRCMTNLERCALEFLCGSTDLYSDSVTTLSRLLELRTCWFFDEQTWPLPEFRLFRFPALKSLSILAEDYPLPFITFTYILEQSNASLEKLELSSQVGHNRDDLVSFFHTNAMASVTTLRLWVTVPQQHELAIHGAIISLLVEGSLLPLLHTIEIVIAEPRTSFALDLVALAKTVRARKASGVGIRNLVIVHRQGEIGTGYSLPPILEVLQEEGLDVVVRLTDDCFVG